MKSVVFDSGTLINLSINGLLDILEKLKSNFKGKFLITQEVYYETVQRPSNINKFELGALRIQQLVESKVLEFPESLKISSQTLKEKTKQLMDIANHYLQLDGNWIKIVSDGEMSCLALSDELSKQGIDNIISIDERTTRILAEKPGNLEKIMSERIHRKVNLVAKDFKIFSKYKFIRSSEIVFVAYKKGLINLKGKKVLEALLYATKFKGSAISFEEIDALKKL